MSLLPGHRPRRAVALGVLAASAATSVLTACSSTTTGTGSAAAPGGASGSVSSSGPSTSSGPTGPTTPAALSAQLLAGLQKVTSLKLTLTSQAAGVAVTATGSETLADGKVTGLDLREVIGGMTLRILIVGGVSYAQLPTSLNTTGKPWVKLSATSTNPTIAQLATSLSQATKQASLTSTAEFAQAASDIENKGSATVSGQPATHYTLTVDVAKLTDLDKASGGALSKSGLTSIPVDLYLDAQGRPVQTVENITVQGQKVTSTVLVSDYDAPVTITAPPADQVGTS